MIENIKFGGISHVVLLYYFSDVKVEENNFTNKKVSNQTTIEAPKSILLLITIYTFILISNYTSYTDRIVDC